jgi:PKD repeat protein
MTLLPLLLVTVASTIGPPPARAADRLTVIVVDGDEAANIVADRLAAEPVIEVRDRENRRVPGAVVRFVIRKTRDRLIAAFTNGQAEARTITDVTGRAAVNAVTPLEPGSFQIDVEVSYRGDTGKAVIRQTNFGTTADAKAAGREPGKSTSSNAQAPTAATAATAAQAPAAVAAASAGGGVSKLAVIGLVAGGAAGAGAAVVLSQKESAPPAVGRVTSLTPSVTNGIHSATAFAFSAQVADFDQGSIQYRWEFGDGAVSSDPAPTHVYAAPGTFTVVVTVSDARQSVRAEVAVTVHTISGTWTYTSAAGPSSIQLTQSGSAVTGVATVNNGPTFQPYGPCPVDGTARAGTPALVLSRPACPHPMFAPLIPAEYRLNLSADGQTLTGTVTSIISTGPVSENPIVLRR